jgi:thioredoxin 1
MSIQLLNGVYHIEDEETFAEFIKKSLDDTNVIVFVKYSAPWCGPCKKIQPLYEQLASSYKNCIFTCVDTDKVTDIASTYNVTSLPTFAVIKNGVYQEIMKGADSNKLQKQITNFSKNIHIKTL